MEKKILEIISWYEKPDWNERLTKYALSLSLGQLITHIEAIKTVIANDVNAPDMLFISCGCFVSVLKDKLDI